jgi:opacity protein-like surface antigen
MKPDKSYLICRLADREVPFDLNKELNDLQMKPLRIIVAALLGIIVTATTQAQTGKLNVNIHYSAATPTGSFKDFVDKTSFRGWTGSLLYGINNHISVGLGLGFHDFYQKYPRDVYKLSDGSDISAVVTNSVQTIPLLAAAQYNFLPGKAIQPYIGVGVGGNLVVYKQYLGEFADSKNKVGFAARPEAGLFIPFTKGENAWGISANAMYNYMPFSYNGVDNLNNWGVGIGARFPLR